MNTGRGPNPPERPDEWVVPAAPDRTTAMREAPMNSHAPPASLADPDSRGDMSHRTTWESKVMRAHLQRLFEHMFWADRRVLDLLNRTPIARQQESVRLITHVLAAERVWLLRLRGEDSSVQPIWPELTLVELNAMHAANETGYTRLLEGLAPEDLEREVEYVNSQGTPFQTPVLDILTHVALHGGYHRGQLARAVQGAGEEPVNTDYITFVREPS